MGTLFGFAVGYVIGAKAGAPGFDELVDSFNAVRHSDEFKGFVDVFKKHAAGTAAVVAERLSGSAATEADDAMAEALARTQVD